jgi:hypothetical protein
LAGVRKRLPATPDSIRRTRRAPARAPWLLGLPLVLGAVISCSPKSQHEVEQAPDPAGFSVAFEDQDAGRLAVCGLDGGAPYYFTPDSLVASGPVTDSLHATVYFIAQPRSQPEALSSVYAVTLSGTDLRQVAALPLSVLDLQITPDGTRLVFLGKYPDSEHVRAYLMVVGEAGFQAVTPENKSVYDPAMAPGGLNFVWHDGRHTDTIFVSSLQQFLTLPIFVFPYTQVSLAWPLGNAFAAVCGPNRLGLCYNLLQDSTGQEVRRETVLIPEQTGVEISHPAFHPDGVRILYVETSSLEPGPSALCLIDRNSLKITRIPVDCRRPTHPVWVRGIRP